MVVMRIRPAARAAFAALLAILSVTTRAQQSDPNPDSKLTTVLADLVRASVTTTALATESTRPASVRDAIEGRRLRIDANNEVQVYVLLSAVTEDTLRQLTDAGVTIEISDASRRRVQAHLPVSRLTSVARLAAVDAIRLPTYARP